MKKFGLVFEEVMCLGVMYGDILSNYIEFIVVLDVVVVVIVKGKLCKF